MIIQTQVMHGRRVFHFLRIGIHCLILAALATASYAGQARKSTMHWENPFHMRLAWSYPFEIGRHALPYTSAQTAKFSIFQDHVWSGTPTGRVLGIERKHGTLKYKIRLASKPIYAPPIVDNNIIYVSTLGGKVLAWDVLKRRQLWEYKTSSPVMGRSILSENYILYVQNNNGVLYALDAKTGKWLWLHKHRSSNYSSSRNASIPEYFDHPSPILTNNKIYSIASDGDMVALNALDGSIIWNLELSRFIQRSHLASNVPFRFFLKKGQGDKIIVCGNLLGCMRINEHGKIDWHNQDAAPNVEPILGSDLKQFFIYNVTKNTLFALNKKSGKTIWKKIIKIEFPGVAMAAFEVKEVAIIMIGRRFINQKNGEKLGSCRNKCFRASPLQHEYSKQSLFTLDTNGNITSLKFYEL